MQHCGLGYGFQVGPSKKRETTGNPQVILPRRSPVEAETTAHTHRTHSQWLKLVPEITGKYVQRVPALRGFLVLCVTQYSCISGTVLKTQLTQKIPY